LIIDEDSDLFAGEALRECKRGHFYHWLGWAGLVISAAAWRSVQIDWAGDLSM
jgi:hypothetical protein